MNIFNTFGAIVFFMLGAYFLIKKFPLYEFYTLFLPKYLKQMPTQQENRARLAIAAQAYIDAYLAKYELATNPAGASQAEWEADSSTVWLMSQLRTDAQDAQSLISEVDTKAQAYDAILAENDIIIRDAFKANEIKERIEGDDSGGWNINYDEVGDTLFVTGLIPFSPDQLANLFMWQAGDVGVVETGGFVSLWADQSGNGNDLVAAGALQPEYDSTDHFLKFVGSYSMNTATLPLSIAQDITMFLVMTNTTSGLSVFLETSTNFNSHDGFAITLNEGSDGDIRIASHGNVATDDKIINGPKATLMLVRPSIDRNSGKDCSIFLNGSSTGSTAGNNANNTSNFDDNILYFGSRANASFFFTGHVHEFLMFTRALTTFECGLVEDYLNTKYSL